MHTNESHLLSFENYLTRQRLTLKFFRIINSAPLFSSPLSTHLSFICLTLQCTFTVYFPSFWKIMSSYYSICVTCTNINSYYCTFCDNLCSRSRKIFPNHYSRFWKYISSRYGDHSSASVMRTIYLVQVLVET